MPLFQPINTLRPLIALWHAPHVGPATFQKIKMRCSNLNEVFAQPKSWAEALDLEPATVAYLMDPDWESVDATLKWAEAAHHWVLTKEDEDYPILLKDLPDAPPLLYVAGEPSYLNDPQIAMVGSRQMSAYGQENAKQFATDLAEKGFTITSGLALGIDGISHQSALDAGGTTIAVMATGMDQIYPATHLKLAHRILEQGCLVSEMPLGSGADKRHFPRRNRIISGLSLGVLVVEAALQSGSLITARFANEQNREVFTIPGSIHNPMAKGCHQLLKSGAKLVESAADILLELKPWLEAQLNPATFQSKPVVDQSVKVKNTFDKSYLDLLKVVGYDPAPIDQIAQKIDLPTASLASMLLRLELEGYVSQDALGYIKIKEIQ